MRAIAIADDDSLVGHLDASSVDVLISLGDLWDATIENASDRYHPNRIFAVRGNHDSDALFQSFVTPPHLTIESYFGMRFGGFNGSWRYKPRGHHLYDQAEVVSLLRSFPRVDVFVAHNSPKGFHQRDDGVHQGFDGFLKLHRKYPTPLLYSWPSTPEYDDEDRRDDVDRGIWGGHHRDRHQQRTMKFRTEPLEWHPNALVLLEGGISAADIAE